MTTQAVRTEQTKLLANACNNLGVATIVTGAIGPIVAFLVGTLTVDDPYRLLSLVMICLVSGVGLLRLARSILEDIVG